MKAIGYIVTTLFLTVYGMIMNGWALSKLWKWFIATTFALPPLTIPAAIGFAIVVNYLTQKIDDKNSDEPFWQKLARGAVISTLKPLFAVGFGAIVRLWL